MAEIDIIIAGRPYKVGCRDGEEETLRAAAPDPEHASRAERIAQRLESLADALEAEGSTT